MLVIMKKEIYASLEITDTEVRLMVGEFFNGRLILLAQDSVYNSTISNFKIINRELLKQNIRKLVHAISQQLEFSIERVILLLPASKFKRKTHRLNVKTETGILRFSDVGQAIQACLMNESDSDGVVANTVCNKYYVNNIPYRKLPVKETAHRFNVDLDLLLVDRKLAYEYVMVVEESGLEVLDVCLDMFAVCKEASLLEKTVGQNIILIKGDYQTTSLGLISKGQFLECTSIDFGLKKLIDRFNKQYRVHSNLAEMLIKYCVESNPELLNNRLIHLENHKFDVGITNEALSKLLLPLVDEYVSRINELCQPILESGPTSVVFTGEASKMLALVQRLKDALATDVRVYIPETIGARDAKLTSLLGSMYAFKDMSEIKSNKLVSINLNEYDKLMSSLNRTKETNSITSKISNLINK